MEILAWASVSLVSAASLATCFFLDTEVILSTNHRCAPKMEVCRLVNREVEELPPPEAWAEDADAASFEVETTILGGLELDKSPGWFEEGGFAFEAPASLSFTLVDLAEAWLLNSEDFLGIMATSDWAGLLQTGSVGILHQDIWRNTYVGQVYST